MKWDEQAALLLRKAHADEQAMEVLIASGSIGPELIGFHAQQAAEKYLKALMSHRHIAFPRTHDLRTLLDSLDADGLPAADGIDEICRLQPYAVEQRYDDVPAGTESIPAADWMASRVKAVRAWVEANLDAPKNI